MISATYWGELVSYDPEEEIWRRADGTKAAHLNKMSRNIWSAPSGHPEPLRYMAERIQEKVGGAEILEIVEIIEPPEEDIEDAPLDAVF